MPVGLSFRQRLPLLISALTAVALVVWGVLAYVEVRRSAREAAELRLESIAEQVTQFRRTAFVERRRLEESVAQSPEVLDAITGLPMDTAALRAELERLRPRAEGDMPVSIRDSNGDPVFGIGAFPYETDPDPTPPLARRWVEGPFRLVEGNAVNWHSVPVTDSAGEPVGWITHRRRYVGVGMDLSLSGPGVRTRMGLYGDSVWVDPGSGEPVAPPAVIDFSGAFESSSQDGEEVLAVAEAFEGRPMAVLIEMPMTEVLARPRAFLRRMISVGALLLLAVLFVGWHLGGRLTVPLERLAAAADALAEGTYDRPVGLEGRDEMRRVTRAFNHMAERVAETETALRQRLNEVSALALRLEDANFRAERARAEAQEASQAKSDLLAAVSHEIRTPVSVLLAYADLLKQGGGDLFERLRKHAEYARRIEESGELLVRLMNDLLDLSVVESGELRIETVPVSAEELIDRVVSSQTASAERKGVTLSSRCPEGTTFYGDPQRVQQILLNLVSNAVKFTPAGGSVVVDCEAKAGGPAHLGNGAHPWLCVAVEDTGIGIDPDQLERVFEPFFQGEARPTGTDGARPAGAGLGLAISRRLANLMQGDITVESDPGEGSRFSLWLPVQEHRAGTTPREASLPSGRT